MRHPAGSRLLYGQLSILTGQNFRRTHADGASNPTMLKRSSSQHRVHGQRPLCRSSHLRASRPERRVAIRLGTGPLILPFLISSPRFAVRPQGLCASTCADTGARLSQNRCSPQWGSHPANSSSNAFASPSDRACRSHPVNRGQQFGRFWSRHRRVNYQRRYDGLSTPKDFGPVDTRARR